MDSLQLWVAIDLRHITTAKVFSLQTLFDFAATPLIDSPFLWTTSRGQSPTCLSIPSIMLKPPTEQEIWRFVATTHECDQVPLKYSDIQDTWAKKIAPNPFAHGHFRAFMYAMKTLIPSSDFPAKAPELMQTVQDSETALFWLRELHTRIVEPLTTFVLYEGDVDRPTSWQCGRYRYVPTTAVTKPAPPHDLIPKIMHNWLKDYAAFHAKIKDKVKNPYGIDQQTSQEIFKRCENINLFFCTVQPMACLNQRMGRFMENVFRLAWCLPLKFLSPGGLTSDYPKFIPALEQYQNEEIPKLVEAAKLVRG